MQGEAAVSTRQAEETGPARLKDAGQSMEAIAPSEAELATRGARTAEQVGGQRKGDFPRHRPCQDLRLVVAPPESAVPVERHGEGHFRAQRPGQEKRAGPERRLERKNWTEGFHPFELEHLDQPADVPVIVGRPENGSQGATGRRAHPRRPAYRLPAGKADTAALAPGQDLRAQQAVGGEHPHQQPLQEPPGEGGTILQPAYP